MMTERQRQFRVNYKSNINPTYNGLLHVCVTEGLRPIMAKFRTDHSSVALDGPQLTEEERRVMTAA